VLRNFGRKRIERRVGDAYRECRPGSENADGRNVGGRGVAGAQSKTDEKKEKQAPTHVGCSFAAPAVVYWPQMIRLTYCAVALLLVLAGCGGSAPFSPGAPSAARRVPLTSSRWIPTAGESIQIQYDGKLDLGVDATIYDLDMFDTKASVVRKIHNMGRKAVCYISVGTWEKWRPDAGQFPKSVIGNKDGHWAGERWLDIRQTAVLEPIMTARYQLCKKKGFDGIDPDNIAGYQSKTGFPLTASEQLTYDEWVATQAHDLGLTVDQKNDNNQIKDLVNYFDFGVDEQCFVQGWCKQLTAYTNNNRLVVDIEYTNQMTRTRFLDKVCPSDANYKLTPILKKLELTAWIVTCPSS
jgi:endo-alpha-1,4-polygalactosaminidase (GH114 family)